MHQNAIMGTDVRLLSGVILLTRCSHRFSSSSSILVPEVPLPYRTQERSSPPHRFHSCIESRYKRRERPDKQTRAGVQLVYGCHVVLHYLCQFLRQLQLFRSGDGRIHISRKIKFVAYGPLSFSSCFPFLPDSSLCLVCTAACPSEFVLASFPDSSLESSPRHPTVPPVLTSSQRTGPWRGQASMVATLR